MDSYVTNTQRCSCGQSWNNRESVMPDRRFCPANQAGVLEQGYALAMAYVPWQQWRTTYPLERVLDQGTIFPDLDLQFLYGRCVR